MRMNSFADIYGVCTHLNRLGDRANHATCVRANHAAAQDFAVAMGFG